MLYYNYENLMFASLASNRRQTVFRLRVDVCPVILVWFLDIESQLMDCLEMRFEASSESTCHLAIQLGIVRHKDCIFIYKPHHTVRVTVYLICVPRNE